MRKSTVFRRLCMLLFVCTVILTCAASYYLSGNYLQGDLCSDMVYAHHLFETGTLISDGWNGGNELHVLRADWLFMLLFHVFEDWRMVRFVGTVLMQAFLVLSFGYLLRQVKASRESFFIGASLLLMPYHFAYGVNVLYGVFYTHFLIAEFIMVGLVLSIGRKSSKHIAVIVRMLLLFVLGFGFSLGGPRTLLNIGGPLFLASSVLLRSVPLRKNRMFIASTLCVVACLAGYLINTTLLLDIQSTRSYPLITRFALFGRLDVILLNLLKNFGFQNRVILTTLTGVFAITGTLLFLCYAVFCICTLKQDALRDDTSIPHGEKLLRLMAVFSLCVMVIYKVFIHDTNDNETYYILITVWFIPCLMTSFSREKVIFRRRIILVLCTMMYFTGLYSLASFVRPDEYPQLDSVTFHNIKTASNLEGSVNFLQEEGFTFGYAEFWSASVVTEKSDGTISVAAVTLQPDEQKPLDRNTLLSLDEVINHKDERPFILLTMAEEQTLLNSHPNVMASMNRIYADGLYVVYEPAHPDDIFSFIVQ